MVQWDSWKYVSGTSGLIKICTTGIMTNVTGTRGFMKSVSHIQWCLLSGPRSEILTVVNRKSYLCPQWARGSTDMKNYKLGKTVPKKCDTL